MNARTIKRILMRGRRTVFWGRRAYVTLRIPFSAFPDTPPEPYDHLPPGWTRGTFSVAECNHRDGTVSYLSLSSISGGLIEEVREDPSAIDVRPHPHFDDGSAAWVQCEVQRRKINLADELDIGEIVETRYPKTDPSLSWALDMYAAQKAVDAWKYRRLEGKDAGELREHIARVEWHCKTMYTEFSRDAAMLTFAVPWAHHDQKMGFCADLPRLVQHLKDRGVKPSVYAGLARP